MEFVPTSHLNRNLIYHGYIFSRSKWNANGSINWKCHNYFQKDQTHCKITCPTIGSEFVLERAAISQRRSWKPNPRSTGKGEESCNAIDTRSC